jgi:alpha-amylase
MPFGLQWNKFDGVDEGTGLSYGFHGYWARDWTNLDPNFGTKEDLRH